MSTSQFRTARHGLDRRELRQLVSRIAADPDQWRPHVRLDGCDRHFEQLRRDDEVDVWVISWANGNDTGFHDHDTSQGAVAVVEGEIIEERLALAGRPRELHHRAGAVFDFDASHVHRMRQRTDTPAVSIHAYSPPLSRLGAYAVGSDGTLRRRSIPYTDELRPVEAAM
jgi:predicted metal-dependent enzyme (double-stranded beta helix superfamily)